jgi:hypothetical protein
MDQLVEDGQYLFAVVVYAFQTLAEIRLVTLGPHPLFKDGHGDVYVVAELFG